MPSGKIGRSRGKRRRGGPAESFRLIGMVHLPALPGSAHAKLSMDRIVARAVDEAGQLAKAGFGAVIIENFGDAPFAADVVPPETIAAMSVVVDRVVRGCGMPVGVNVLRNDALAALAVACATGASFIRVNVLSGIYGTDQGLITGRAHELLRRRAAVAPHIRICADVHVKHAVPLSQPDLGLAAEETAYRAGADVLILSGPATGAPADLDDARRVREAVPDRPIWIGSGVTADAVADYLELTDAVIVGTALKRGGRTTASLDMARVRRLASASRRAN